MNNQEIERLSTLTELKEKLGGLDKMKLQDRGEYKKLMILKKRQDDPEKVKEDEDKNKFLGKLNEDATKGIKTRKGIDTLAKRANLKKLADKCLTKIVDRRVKKIQGESTRMHSTVFPQSVYNRLEDLTEDLKSISDNAIFKISTMVCIIVEEYLDNFDKKNSVAKKPKKSKEKSKKEPITEPTNE